MAEKGVPNKPQSAIKTGKARLMTAAKLIGSPAERFIAWKDLADGSLVVIDYDGRKYQFSQAELETEG